jgi:hypothetical protein
VALAALAFDDMSEAASVGDTEFVVECEELEDSSAPFVRAMFSSGSAISLQPSRTYEIARDAARTAATAVSAEVSDRRARG